MLNQYWLGLKDVEPDILGRAYEYLLRQPASFRAEAIVHELLHLKVPNHGPLFRSLLRAYLTEYRLADDDAAKCSHRRVY